MDVLICSRIPEKASCLFSHIRQQLLIGKLGKRYGIKFYPCLLNFRKKLPELLQRGLFLIWIAEVELAV